MASWVEQEAKRWARIYKYGPEIWRNLKVSLEQAVSDYTRIYTPEGKQEFEYTDCMPVTENCVRIRLVPDSTGKAEKSIEVRFRPETYMIEVDREAIFSIGLPMNDSTVVLMKDGNPITIEDASKQLLIPLFSLIPQRKPNI
jgi:hypothetical protein